MRSPSPATMQSAPPGTPGAAQSGAAALAAAAGAASVAAGAECRSGLCRPRQRSAADRCARRRERRAVRRHRARRCHWMALGAIRILRSRSRISASQITKSSPRAVPMTSSFSLRRSISIVRRRRRVRSSPDQAADRRSGSRPARRPVSTDDVARRTAYSISGKSAIRSNSNATINSYNPFYTTALSFNFTQPLGRGTGTDETRRQFELSLANAQANRAQALTSVSQTITNVSNTYWNLVAAWRNVGIQEEGLRQAQAQAQSNARLAARGAAAPVDIVESQTQVNVFQDNVFAALSERAALADAAQAT